MMHAGSGRCIPELRDVYELAPLMTYDGWEGDVGYVEKRWANDGHVDIQSEVGRMRRKQCLHEGDRSDAALQVLDGVKLGLTYPGWEGDVGYVETGWANDGHVDIQGKVGRMRRKQYLHEGDRSDAALQVLDGVKGGLTYPGWEEDVGYVERRWVNDGQVDIQREVEALHRAQLLHAALS